MRPRATPSPSTAPSSRRGAELSDAPPAGSEEEARPKRRPRRGPSALQRFLPKFHWELLACGVGGHLLVGTDAAEVRPSDRLLAREQDGVRWYRCLRCDSWLALAPAHRSHPPLPAGREEIELPLRGRPLRDKFILRLIAVDKAFRFLLFAALTVGVFLIAANETGVRDFYYRLLVRLPRQQ